MGYKVFGSYKYWDDSVEQFCPHRTIVRDYVNVFKVGLEAAGHIFKGENDNEDLSRYTDDFIMGKLKDRMYDSSITALFISPNMREFYESERNQWIPWEISYSLREETRNNRTSHANAIVGIVLPGITGDYSYWQTMWNFSIVNENIENGYIKLVAWHIFMKNITYYLEEAIRRRDNTPIIKIKKSI